MKKGKAQGLKSLRENSAYKLKPAGVCLSFPHKGRVGEP
jgi:hypothetical protein